MNDLSSDTSRDKCSKIVNTYEITDLSGYTSSELSREVSEIRAEREVN